MLLSVISSVVRASSVGRFPLTGFQCGMHPLADFQCRTCPAPTSHATPSRPPSHGENSTLTSLRRRTHRPLLSDPLAGKSPVFHTLDPQASTLTPERSLVPPTPSGNQTSAQKRDPYAQRPASHSHMTTSSSGPLVWSIGLSPVSNLAQWTLNSQPIAAAKWSICLQGQSQDICLPKGGRTSPQGGPELGRAGVSKKRKQG